MKKNIIGDPAKADKKLIDAYKNEQFMRLVTGKDVRVSNVEKALGPNEMAYLEEQRKTLARNSAKEHKGQKELFTMTSISITGEGSFTCVETKVFPNRDGAVGYMLQTIKELTGKTPKPTERKPKASGTGRNGSFSVDISGNLSGSADLNGYLLGRCETEYARTYFFIDTTWMDKKLLK